MTTEEITSLIEARRKTNDEMADYWLERENEERATQYLDRSFELKMILEEIEEAGKAERK